MSDDHTPAPPPPPDGGYRQPPGGYNPQVPARGDGTPPWQSLGKQVLGLKLVSERTGQPIGAGMAFVRDLAHIVDSIICYVGWLFPLWDAKRQTIGDKLVGTLV